MTMPDELNIYRDCPDLISRVKKLKSFLRYPRDVEILEEVIVFLEAHSRSILPQTPPKA